MVRPVAYEGREPYIFVSYAHEDSDRVLSIISALQEQGFRVWYDADIDIPDSATSIGEDAFVFCHRLIIYGKQDSVAEQYAEEHKIAFKAI